MSSSEGLCERRHSIHTTAMTDRLGGVKCTWYRYMVRKVSVPGELVNPLEWIDQLPHITTVDRARRRLSAIIARATKPKSCLL